MFAANVHLASVALPNTDTAPPYAAVRQRERARERDAGQR